MTVQPSARRDLGGDATGEPRAELRAELRRLLPRLAEHVTRQRRRGRTPSTDAVLGFAIEEGEAEGLIAELDEDLQQPALPSEPRSPACERLGARASPLARAAAAFELSPLEYDAVLLALAVELDARFARLMGFLNDHVGHTRPTLGFVAALGPGPAPFPSELAARPFLRDGLLETDGEGPLSALSLAVPRGLLPRLVASGDAALSELAGVRVHRLDHAALAELSLGARAREHLGAWAHARRERRPAPVLMVSGPRGSGRSTAARAALGVAGEEVALEVALSLDRLAERLLEARREARWHAAALVLRLPEDAREAELAALWSGLRALDRACVLVGSRAALEAAALSAPEEPLMVPLPPPTIEGRARQWRALLPPEISHAEIGELAVRFPFAPHTIGRAARRAVTAQDVLPPEQRRLEVSAVERVCRELGAAAMGSLAEHVPHVYSREDLVLPAALLAELDLAVAWVRKRRRVLDEWAFSRRVALGRGLTALFTGLPGTGKTMTAQVLARDLHLDLYRVDLSRLVSKYIGETEKNLAQLFDEASASGVVLFFDEADALFGKRSEVRDAHDRYANLEVSYLLQRMEQHEGVTILATNRVGDMDEAFVRRFHFILDFPMPDEAQRLRIWEGMFPSEAECEAELDLASLARGFELSGGEIRNAVLSAAYFAAAEDVPIGRQHLKRALRRELAKTGRILDERQRVELDGGTRRSAGAAHLVKTSRS